jgi:hypothetical protein
MSGRHPEARPILERALADVLGEAAASHLRDDSPLLATAGTGVLLPADALGLADAVEQRAAEAGVRCALTDEDFLLTGTSLTLADLEERITLRLTADDEERT